MSKLISLEMFHLYIVHCSILFQGVWSTSFSGLAIAHRYRYRPHRETSWEHNTDFCFRYMYTFKAHYHSRKFSTDRKFSENIIVKSSIFFSDWKFVSANRILQMFLSAENCLEWKGT
jgi:hypothetical protein